MHSISYPNLQPVSVPVPLRLSLRRGSTAIATPSPWWLSLPFFILFSSLFARIIVDCDHGERRQWSGLDMLQTLHPYWPCHQRQSLVITAIGAGFASLVSTRQICVYEIRVPFASIADFNRVCFWFHIL